MKDKRFLIVSTGVTPYLTEPSYTELAFKLAKSIRSTGGEVRIFMPRFGVINERRLQLHEVIRLSGKNIVVDDEDIPLIIKVASIPKERMQVYFIDSMENFNQKLFLKKEDGSLREDISDFMVFFTKGVVETANKLNWNADYVIHMGWFTSLLPLYLKTYYKDNPLLAHTQMMHVLVNDVHFEGELPGDLESKFKFDELDPDMYKKFLPSTEENLIKGASELADILLIGEENPEPFLQEIFESYPNKKGKITLELLENNPKIFKDILEQFQT